MSLEGLCDLPKLKKKNHHQASLVSLLRSNPCVRVDHCRSGVFWFSLSRSLLARGLMLLMGGKEETAGLICAVAQIIGQPLALRLVSSEKKKKHLRISFEIQYLTSW